jgi:pyroglutamyl-peptidase
MRTVHLTCFDAFGALPENPTRWLVAALSPPPGWRAVKTVLPTSYARVSGEVDRIFDQRPAAVVMFGYTGQADRLRLEHMARNQDGSPRPDNDGRIGGPVIRPGAPPAYWSTVNLAPALSALCRRAVPFTYSIDAGGYVCNHSYFLALDRAWAASRVVPCLFVHIPWPRTRAQRSQIRRGAGLVLDGILHARHPATGEGCAGNAMRTRSANSGPGSTPSSRRTMSRYRS